MNDKFVKKWFVVQIKPKSYDLAYRNLERQGFEAFAPKMRITTKKENKFINKDVLVFPGYMFVGVGRQSCNWTKIKSTYGVAKVLFFNDKAAEISHDLILALKNRFEVKFNQKTEESVKAGDTIKFNNGPFVNLIARVEAIDKHSRIWLILEAMGGPQKLNFQRTNSIEYIKV